MEEIKVVPYIPDEDYDHPAMVVDFYEFTRANCLFLNGFKDTTLVFDMFFRKNPDNMGYSISAGQRKLTRFLLNYHFNEQDIQWLRTKGMSEEFCNYLRTYRWKGDMYALPEGTVCYPHVQMVRIECDLVGAILIEKYPNDPNRRVKSARIDSGDLARGSKRLRKALDAAGKPYIKLVASNGLDEKKIANMELYEHAHFDSYGVGENLITSASDPVFGGVYKLVAVKQADGSYQPKMKCSDSASKAIIPGKKMPWRLYDENGQAQCDLIAMDGEVIEAGKPVTMVNLDPDAIERTITITPTKVKQLLVPHILNGELAIELPSIAEKKAYIAQQLTEETWETELRIECPHKHYVNMTPAVAECRSRMYAELHGGKV